MEAGEYIFGGLVAGNWPHSLYHGVMLTDYKLWAQQFHLTVNGAFKLQFIFVML